MVEFKELKLSEVFKKESIQRGKRIVKNDRKPGRIPLVTAGKENYGVSGYIKEHTAYSEGNVMTIDMFGNVFYREYGFFFDDNIIVFDEEFTKGVYLYLTSTLSKLSHLHGYSKQFRYKDISDTNVTIPINPDGTPDFEYMENYIKEIEQKYISNLKQKLDTDKTNLLKVIGKKEEDLETVIEEGFTEDTEYGEFKVGDLFDGYIGKFVGPDYRRKDIEGDYKIPLVTSQTTNKGIQAYVKEGEYRQFCRCLSIAKDGNGGTTFYHEYPFTVGNVAMAIFAKDKYKDSIKSKNVYMYLGTSVEKLAKSFGSYSKKVGWNLFGMSIKLPVTSEGEPDFGYMERYISYIELAHTHNYIETEQERIGKIEELIR